MTTKKLLPRILQAGFLLAAILPAQSPELAVVVNKNNPISSLTKGQIKKILTGVQATWPNGEKVMVVMAAPGDALRAAALRIFCNMTEQQYAADQLHAKFVGEDRTQPNVMLHEKAIAPLVAIVPGAIAVIPSTDVVDQVKKVTTN